MLLKNNITAIYFITFAFFVFDKVNKTEFYGSEF